MLNMTAVGRIGRDVELRTTPQGESVCNVVIGCNYGRKGQDGKFPTQWVEGTIWGKRAEAMAEYLTKGKQVILALSDVHIETYEGKNGQGSKLLGRVDNIAFGADAAGGQQQAAPQRQQAPARQPQRQAPQRTSGGQQSGGYDDLDDGSDIPF